MLVQYYDTGSLVEPQSLCLAYWILATFLLCLSHSSRRLARELGRHRHTC